MRKLFAAFFTAILMVAGLQVMTALPANAADCELKFDNFGKYVRDGDGDGSDDPFVKAWVWYNNCKTPDPGGQHWAKVQWVRVQVNWPGTSLDCADGKWSDGAYWNFYFWRPYSGANFNPPQFHLKCDSSGINGTTRTYTEHPDNVRLYFGPDMNRPRWRAYVRVTKKWHEDIDTTHGEDFNPWD